MAESVISAEYKGRLAIITINNPKKLNALDQNGYFALSRAMREVAEHNEVYITLLIGKGRFFSAGADVGLGSVSTGSGSGKEGQSDEHRFWLSNFLAYNLNITQAFYTHPKILVVGLNGPVVGLSAALVSFADFIYCTPSTFLLTPFSSLGLVAEGGSSRALVQRLGLARANEALIMSRRIPANDLLAAGFVNRIFSECATTTGDQRGDDDRFRNLVLREIDDHLGDHINGDSMLGIKALIRRPEMDVLERQNSSEVFAGLQRFLTGVPLQEFQKLASGQKRHKL